MKSATNPYSPPLTRTKGSPMPASRLWWWPIVCGFVAAPIQILFETTTGVGIQFDYCFPTYYVLNTLFGIDAAIGIGVQYFIYGVILGVSIRFNRLRAALMLLIMFHLFCYLSCDSITKMLTYYGF